MIVILDTATGQAHHFSTRRKASVFLNVSARTLRRWLVMPFYLNKNYIILFTSQELSRLTDKQFPEVVKVNGRMPVEGSKRPVQGLSSKAEGYDLSEEKRQVAESLIDTKAIIKT